MEIVFNKPYYRPYMRWDMWKFQVTLCCSISYLHYIYVHSLYLCPLICNVCARVTSPTKHINLTEKKCVINIRGFSGFTCLNGIFLIYISRKQGYPGNTKKWNRLWHWYNEFFLNINQSKGFGTRQTIFFYLILAVGLGFFLSQV